MKLFSIRWGRLSTQITVALAALFLLLVICGVGATWVSNAAENDLRRSQTARTFNTELDERIDNAQRMLKLTLPMYVSQQGEFYLAARDAMKNQAYESVSLLPAFNAWNGLLNLRLSRITVCDSAFKAKAWVGAAGVGKAMSVGQDCGGPWLKEAAQRYSDNPTQIRPPEGVARVGDAFYARQYVFVQTLNLDTFSNEISMVLVIDQDLSPVLSQARKSLELVAAAPRLDASVSGHAVRGDRLVVDVPLHGVAGETVGYAELQRDISKQQSEQLSSLILQVLGASAVLGAAGVGVVLFLRRRVFAPLSALAASAAMLDDIPSPDQVPFGDRRDEIGELSAGVRAGVAGRAAELAAKQAAEAANTAKSEFLAVMSHEIRTPLNGVLGMAQVMASDPLSKLQRERLEVISRSGATLLAILNDMLDLSKIEAGKLELEDGAFDVEDLALGALGAFTAVAQSKGVSFSLAITPAACGLYRGDSVRVRQILYNLVSNAVKFTEAGEVRVSIDRTDAGVQLAVRDTGVGIAADRIDQLFQKFVQAEASTTRRFGGTGLGLSICAQLCKAMGGEITVDSFLGEGSTFTARLPLERLGDAAEGPHAPPAAPAAPSVEGLSGLRVLAAEDNPTNQLVLKTILAQLGVWPVIVGDGEAAVEAWARDEWDLILMDVQMPVMDGPTAARAIRDGEARTGRAPTPIIALTANVMTHQVETYRAAGMTGFVAKPINIAELFLAISELSLRAEPTPRPMTARRPRKRAAAPL